MKYAKALFFLVFFFFAMLFFAQNMEQLSQAVAMELTLFGTRLFLVAPALYTLLLCAFVVGGATMMLFFVFEKIRLTRTLSQSNKKLRTLEQEVTSLRNLPLEGSDFGQTKTSASSS